MNKNYPSEKIDHKSMIDRTKYLNGNQLNFWTFKYIAPSFWHSDIIYKFQCGGFNATPVEVKLNAILKSKCVNS